MSVVSQVFDLLDFPLFPSVWQTVTLPLASPNFSSFIFQEKTDTHKGVGRVYISRIFAYYKKALIFKSHVSTLRYRLSLRDALGGRLQENGR